MSAQHIVQFRCQKAIGVRCQKAIGVSRTSVNFGMVEDPAKPAWEQLRCGGRLSQLAVKVPELEEIFGSAEIVVISLTCKTLPETPGRVSAAPFRSQWTHADP